MAAGVDRRHPGDRSATSDRAGPSGGKRERLALEGLGVVGRQQPFEVDRGERRPIRGLERPGVQDDPDAARRARPPWSRPGDPWRPRSRRRAGGRSRRSRSSSARSVTTTTSASTMIRRLIFDWPIRRSRNVIGTSRIRAPARLARNVISIWNTYPPACTPSNGTAARVEARQALKPPVRSCGPSARTVRAKRLPPRDTIRRARPQSTTPPPGAYRESRSRDRRSRRRSARRAREARPGRG